MTRYTMPARSQGKLYTQRAAARLECTVRSTSLARTHIVLNNTPPLPSMARNDEAVEVNARGTVKALIKATGLNPHLSVCGWPFCLGDLDDVNEAEGGVK